MRKLVLLLLVTGCEDALDQRLALVSQPRVLAVVSEPAEAKPGAQVTLSALVASPDGPLAEQPVWALCTAPKPPTEDDAVAPGCLADQVTPLGTSPTVTATIPTDACTLFGPDVPPGGYRPRDPDPTGGFYQPVRAETSDAGVAFGFARITCGLANAPGDVAHDFQTMYQANANPVLHPIALAQAAPNSDVTLTASWDEPESYLYYEPSSQSLVVRRESMRVSWFATAGALPVDATAVGEDDPATSASTTWRTPASPGPVWLWVVLRDSRGGIATQTIALTVQ
ncbi:MAG TPA: hypothetical protein VLT45_16775 [Kofleriaceae bacterium]|nr:hypothetical protein [Kofleriaceae bacterium]